MPPSTHRQGGRLRRYLLFVVVVIVAGASYACFRLGTFLYAEDVLHRADAILVLAGTRMERPLEAADLYLEGWAPRIVLTEAEPDSGITILEQRGFEFETDAALARDVMVKLGVPPTAIEIVPPIHDSTASEAHTFRTLSTSRKWKRVILVTSKFHTRRAGFAVRRELKGTGVDVIVRASAYDRADPHHWWRTRADVRWVASEAQKLIVYVLGLGV